MRKQLKVQVMNVLLHTLHSTCGTLHCPGPHLKPFFALTLPAEYFRFWSLWLAFIRRYYSGDWRFYSEIYCPIHVSSIVTYHMKNSFLISLEHIQKLPWIVNTLLFLVNYEQTRYPFQTEFSHTQLLVQTMICSIYCHLCDIIFSYVQHLLCQYDMVWFQETSNRWLLPTEQISYKTFQVIVEFLPNFFSNNKV